MLRRMIPFLFLAVLGLLLAGVAQADPYDGARVYRASDLAVTNNTQTTVPYDNEDHDTTSYHSTVSNTSRLTTNAVGLYLFVANVYWNPNAAGIRTIQIRRDGVDIIGYCGWKASNVVELHQCSAVWYEASSGAHYYEVYVYQNSGADLVLEGDADGDLGTSWFSISKIGD